MNLTSAHCSPFLLLATLLLAQTMAEDQTPDKLIAKQILDRMATAYAKCESYRDSGVVKTVFIRPDRKRTVEKPFTTAFVRPDRFRFEYKNKERRYIVWRKGNDVQTWWDITPGIKKPTSLGLALAAANGVSSRSALTVPALLIPDEVGGRRLTGITEVQRIEDAKLGKADCFRIQGQFGGSPMTIWIDKKTFLVRRIDTQKKFDDFRTEQSTTYQPVINGEISDEMLEFDKTTLGAVDQTPESGIAVPASSRGRSHETVDLKVLKVFSAKDGNAVFRAYLVRWQGQEVIVVDTLVKTDYQVGDTASILVIKLPHPNGKGDRDLLHFNVVPKIPKRR